MNRVLFIAYHFPPLADAGVQRSLKFVQYLPSFGWNPLVVSGPDGQSEPAAGRALGDDVLPKTDIRRVPGPRPQRRQGWPDRADRWLRLRTAFGRWWYSGVLAAGREAGGRFDLILATMSPWESGEAAADLAEEVKRPWVADLRDPWALDEWAVYPSALHRLLEMRRMRRLLSRADAIVMNTAEAASELRRRFPELRSKPVWVITNGFDASDFPEAPPPRSLAFRIVHAGALHTEAGERNRRVKAIRRLLGSATPGIDHLTRSHVFLLEAVERLFKRRADLRTRLEVHLAGQLSDADRHAISSDVVHIHGYLSHKETVALIHSADLLFLPMHDLPEGVRARAVPGKTYEYLGSGRPILAALPDGDARDLLERVPHAFVCRPADVASMAATIGRLVAEVQLTGRQPDALPDLVQSYERPELTAELARLFERTTQQHARPAGRLDRN